MANVTSNYNLNKPLENEKVNISVLNQNMDIIDTNLKSLSDEINEVKDNIPSTDGLVSQTTLNATLTDYAKKSELPDEYDDTELSNRVNTIETNLGGHIVKSNVPENAKFTDTVYDDTALKTELTTAITNTKTEVVNTILGEAVDEDFDTLTEVANWILADTTNSAQLITRVTNLESEIEDKADSSDIPTKVSELANDKQYLTSADIDTSQNHTHTNKTVLDKVTQDYLDKIDGIAEGAEANVQSDWNAVSGDALILNKPEFASVATSGSYTDLINKPTIPSATSQLTNDSGFKTTDNNTTYELSKSGTTIILTGSDGSTTSVTDSDTNTVYTHPSYTAKSSGLYKITVDATGHISSVTAVAKSDITELGIPSSDTNTHYSSKNVVAGNSTSTNDTTSALSNGSVYLISVENGAVTSAHKISGSGATTVTTDASGNIVISSTDTNTTYTLSSFGITATASELNVLDGITATVTELNYCDGVTSNIQAQLDGKASSSHGTHVTYGTTTPKVAGTGDVGTSTGLARIDHVHPAQTSVTGSSGSCTGNSATATKATQDASGNTITTSYASSASLSGNNLLLKSQSGDTLSTVDLSGFDNSSSVGTTVYYQSDEPSVSDTSVWIG